MIYIIIVVVALIAYILILYNTLVKLNNKVKESFSTMDVYLKKRWDLVPNIVETVKSYAELKANDNFKNLSNQLTKIEDDIANSRKYYNGTVIIYNDKVEMFPNNIFAKLFGHKPKTMFEANIDERENIKIEL